MGYDSSSESCRELPWQLRLAPARRLRCLCTESWAAPPHGTLGRALEGCQLPTS